MLYWGQWQSNEEWKWVIDSVDIWIVYPRIMMTFSNQKVLSIREASRHGTHSLETGPGLFFKWFVHIKLL